MDNALAGLVFENDRVLIAPRHSNDAVGQGSSSTTLADLSRRAAESLLWHRNYEAIEAHAELIRRDANSASAFDGLGRALVREGEIQKAIVVFRTALRADPTLTETRYELALAYWRLQDFAHVIEVFAELLSLDPSHVMAHDRLAVALYHVGDFSSSWQHVHAAERLGHQVAPQFRPLLEAAMPEPRH